MTKEWCITGHGSNTDCHQQGSPGNVYDFFAYYYHMLCLWIW